MLIRRFQLAKLLGFCPSPLMEPKLWSLQLMVIELKYLLIHQVARGPNWEKLTLWLTQFGLTKHLTTSDILEEQQMVLWIVSAGIASLQTEIAFKLCAT